MQLYWVMGLVQRNPYFRTMGDSVQQHRCVCCLAHRKVKDVPGRSFYIPTVGCEEVRTTHVLAHCCIATCSACIQGQRYSPPRCTDTCTALLQVLASMAGHWEFVGMPVCTALKLGVDMKGIVVGPEKCLVALVYAF
jgi:hypothetical protein